MERDAEIAQIENDLEVLRARYASYQRLARIERPIYIVLGLIVAIAAAMLVGEMLAFDLLYGLFCAAVVLIFVTAIIWSIKDNGIRWIDIATQRFPRIYDPDFFNVDSPRRPSRSEAESVEQQISDWERRLAELKGR